jgi:hypothetical protein
MHLINQHRIQHSATLYVYTVDDCPPNMVVIQDIPTWPTVNLAQLPWALEKANLHSPTMLEIYHAPGHGWILGIDHAIDLKTLKPPNIIVCTVGVCRCKGLDSLINTGALQSTPLTPMLKRITSPDHFHRHAGACSSNTVASEAVECSCGSYSHTFRLSAPQHPSIISLERPIAALRKVRIAPGRVSGMSDSERVACWL